MEVINLISSIFSIIALPLTLYQLWRVKKISIATKDAIESTRKDFQRTFSIHDLAKYNQTIDSIQQEIKSNKWELVLYRMRDLQAVLIDLNENSYLVEIEDLKSFSSLITQIGIDITHINRQLIAKDTSSLQAERISDNLYEISRSLMIVKSKVFNFKNGR